MTGGCAPESVFCRYLACCISAGGVSDKDLVFNQQFMRTLWLQWLSRCAAASCPFARKLARLRGNSKGRRLFPRNGRNEAGVQSAARSLSACFGRGRRHRYPARWTRISKRIRRMPRSTRQRRLPHALRPRRPAVHRVLSALFRTQKGGLVSSFLCRGWSPLRSTCKLPERISTTPLGAAHRSFCGETERVRPLCSCTPTRPGHFICGTLQDFQQPQQSHEPYMSAPSDVGYVVAALSALNL